MTHLGLRTWRILLRGSYLPMYGFQEYTQGLWAACRQRAALRGRAGMPILSYPAHHIQRSPASSVLAHLPESIDITHTQVPKVYSGAVSSTPKLRASSRDCLGTTTGGQLAPTAMATKLVAADCLRILASSSNPLEYPTNPSWAESRSQRHIDRRRSLHIHPEPLARTHKGSHTAAAAVSALGSISSYSTRQ
jgi:hypothetical protein